MERTLLAVLWPESRPRPGRAPLGFHGGDASAISIPKISERPLSPRIFSAAGPFLVSGSSLPGLGDDVLLVDLAQREEQLGPLVEPGADAVEPSMTTGETGWPFFLSRAISRSALCRRTWTGT